MNQYYMRAWDPDNNRSCNWFADDPTDTPVTTYPPSIPANLTNIAIVLYPSNEGGNTILYGSIDPTTEGNDGDFYINITSWYIFGPKASGTWPTGVPLKGAQGDSGGLGYPGGRLSLTSGVPVTNTDVTSSTIHYTPFIHNNIELFDESDATQLIPFTEKSLTLTDLVTNACYDVFGYIDTGELALEHDVWKNATVTITITSPGVVSWTSHGLTDGDGILFTTTGALPTGLTANTIYYVINSTADTFQVTSHRDGSGINISGTQSGTHTAYSTTKRQNDIAMFKGKYVKYGDNTRLLLGSFQALSSSTTEDSLRNRLLSNVYNTVMRSCVATDTTSSTYTYTTQIWRLARNSNDNKFCIIFTVPRAISMEAHARSTNTTAYVGRMTGIGIDRSNYPDAYCYYGAVPANTPFQASISHMKELTAGAHYVARLEYAIAVGTATWDSSDLITALNGLIFS